MSIGKFDFSGYIYDDIDNNKKHKNQLFPLTMDFFLKKPLTLYKFPIYDLELGPIWQDKLNFSCLSLFVKDMTKDDKKTLIDLLKQFSFTTIVKSSYRFDIYMIIDLNDGILESSCFSGRIDKTKIDYKYFPKGRITGIWSECVNGNIYESFNQRSIQLCELINFRTDFCHEDNRNIEELICKF